MKLINADLLNIFWTNGVKPIKEKVNAHESSISTMNTDISALSTNVSAMSTDVTALKKSVSDGKTLVANAITAQSVTTATDATFQTMANNITDVGTLKYNAGIIAADKRVNANSASYNAGHTAGYNAGRVQGHTDVTSSPKTYNLYTAAQYNAQYNAGVTAADARVSTSSASYKSGYSAGVSAGGAGKITPKIESTSRNGNGFSYSLNIPQGTYILSVCVAGENISGESSIHLTSDTGVNTGLIDSIASTGDNTVASSTCMVVYKVTSSGGTLGISTSLNTMKHRLSYILMKISDSVF